MEWLRPLSALAFVLLLILGAAWLARRHPRLMGRRRAGGLLEVLETLPLGNRRYLLLLRMGERRGLLAVAGDRVALLDEIPGETFDQTLARTTPGEEAGS